MEEYDWESAPNAMLTDADRRYLLGEVDPDEYYDFSSWTRQRRQQIKQRVRQSLVDFMLVRAALPPKDIESILEVDDTLESELMLSGIADIISCLWSNFIFKDASFITEAGIQRAIETIAALEKDRYLSPEVEISVTAAEKAELEDWAQMYESGEEVPINVVRLLSLAGYIESEQYFQRLDKEA